jgi:hypothetical protein
MRDRLAPIFLCMFVAGCVGRQGPAPGMAVVSPAPEEEAPRTVLAVPLPSDGTRTIVVAYPAHACASQASAVFVDPDGKFLGSVSAGTASMLRVPQTMPMIHVFSSVEVTAARGTWFTREDISLRTNPEALVVTPIGAGKHCGSGTPRVDLATRRELEPKIGRLAWIDVDGNRGRAWLDAHRARIDEVLERNPPPEPVIARVTRLR